MRRSSMRVADNDNSRSTRGGCVAHAKAPVTDRDAHLSKWTTCSLSQEPLGADVSACRLGGLYNTPSLHAFLLRDTEDACNWHKDSKLCRRVEHIQSPMRDVTTLHLHRLGLPVSSGAIFSCPVSGAEACGRHHRFVAFWKCGHVVSEKSFKEMLRMAGDCRRSAVTQSSSFGCFVCGAKVHTQNDVILLNPGARNEKLLSPRPDRVAGVGVLKGSPDGTWKGQLTRGNGAILLLGNGEKQKTGQSEGAVKDTESGETGKTGPSKGVAADMEDSATVCVQQEGRSGLGQMAARRAVRRMIKKKRKRTGDVPPSIGYSSEVRGLKAMPMPRPRDLTGGWERVECRSKPGKFYFRHKGMNRTQWEPPPGLTE